MSKYNPDKFMRELIMRAKDGDKKALGEIIESFKPLINNTAISFYIYGYDAEDIKQVATMALINAVNKFDLNRETAFAAYAKECVRNSLYTEIDKASKIYFKDKENKEMAVLIQEKEIIDENINLQEDYIEKEMKINLGKAIDLLNENDKKILKAIYLENKTLKSYSEEEKLEYHKARYMKDKAISNLKELYLTINK